MIPLLCYGAGVLFGLMIPIGSTRWAALFVVSVAFDGFRFQDVSVANVFLIAFLSSLLLDYLLGKRVRFAWTLFPLLALLEIAAISATLAQEPLQSVRLIGSLAMLIAASFGIASLASDARQLRTLISAVIWMGGVLAVTVLGEELLWVLFGIHFKDTVYYLISLERYVFQASGFFSSNALAAFHLVPGTALAAVLRSRVPRGGGRTRLNLYLMLMLSAIVTTVARAAMVSLVALAIVLLIRRAARPGWARLVAIVALIAVVAVSPFFVRFIAGFNINSFAARFGMVRGAFDSVMSHPIVGAGPGARVIPRYSGWMLELAPNFAADTSAQRETHNTLLQIPVELGILGLLVFIVTNVALFSSGIRWSRRVHDSEIPRLLYPVLIALLLTEFFSLFDSVFYTKPVWILFGLAAGAVNVARAASARTALTDSAMRLPAPLASQAPA